MQNQPLLHVKRDIADLRRGCAKEQENKRRTTDGTLVDASFEPAIMSNYLVCKDQKLFPCATNESPSTSHSLEKVRSSMRIISNVPAEQFADARCSVLIISSGDSNRKEQQANENYSFDTPFLIFYCSGEITDFSGLVDKNHKYFLCISGFTVAILKFLICSASS